MRLIYLDESGLGDIAKEPFLVVAGVIVNADKQLIALENRLKEIAGEHLAPEKRKKFFFHATELFSGGRTFDRANWSKEKRWDILDQLASIPAELGVPIVFGFVDRRNSPAPKDWSNKRRLAMDHLAAYSICVATAEAYMRENTEECEVALVIAENNDDTRQFVKHGNDFLRWSDKIEEMPKTLQNYIPMIRIRDTVHFANKLQSPALQMADICAFIIMRYLAQSPNSDRFYRTLAKTYNIRVGPEERGGYHVIWWPRAVPQKS